MQATGLAEAGVTLNNLSLVFLPAPVFEDMLCAAEPADPVGALVEMNRTLWQIDTVDKLVGSGFLFTMRLRHGDEVLSVPVPLPPNVLSTDMAPSAEAVQRRAAATAAGLIRPPLVREIFETAQIVARAVRRVRGQLRRKQLELSLRINDIAGIASLALALIAEIDAAGHPPPCVELAPAAHAAPQHGPQVFGSDVEAPVWFYADPTGRDQGPFSASDLLSWQASNTVPPMWPIRHGPSGQSLSFEELCLRFKPHAATSRPEPVFTGPAAAVVVETMRPTQEAGAASNLGEMFSRIDLVPDKSVTHLLFSGPFRTHVTVATGVTVTGRSAFYCGLTISGPRSAVTRATAALRKVLKDRHLLTVCEKSDHNPGGRFLLPAQYHQAVSAATRAFDRYLVPDMSAPGTRFVFPPFRGISRVLANATVAAAVAKAAGVDTCWAKQEPPTYLLRGDPEAVAMCVRALTLTIRDSALAPLFARADKNSGRFHTNSAAEAAVRAAAVDATVEAFKRHLAAVTGSPTPTKRQREEVTPTKRQREEVTPTKRQREEVTPTKRKKQQKGQRGSDGKGTDLGTATSAGGAAAAPAGATEKDERGGWEGYEKDGHDDDHAGGEEGRHGGEQEEEGEVHAPVEPSFSALGSLAAAGGPSTAGGLEALAAAAAFGGGPGGEDRKPAPC